MSKYFIVETNDTSKSVIEDALRDRGLNFVTVWEASPLYNGYCLTKLAISSIWDYETAAAHGDEEGNEGRRYRSWDELTEQQKHAFTDRLTQFLESYRADHLDLNLLLSDDLTFREAAVDPG